MKKSKVQWSKVKDESKSSSSSRDSTFNISYKSNGHCKESNYYNRKVIDKLRERLKEEMDKMYKKYRFNHDLLQLTVELKFDLDIYYKLKINRMIYNY